MGKFRTKIEFHDGDDLYPAGNIYDEREFPAWKIETWKKAGFIEFVVIKSDGSIVVTG
jgi:hypothetical protein